MQSAIKRAFDIVVAVGGLIFLAPLLAAVALLIRIRMGSPVLFRQQRPGLNGRPFYILKFRTMTNDTDDKGNPLPDEQRLPMLGKFLRSSSIDELPELLNVLRGEMSLVGPRPLLMEYLNYYTPEEARRHNVRPGITGWAQINGRNMVSWEERFKLDVWYTENWNLLLDFRILGATFWQVLRRDGINAASHATMPKFERRISDSSVS